MKRATPETIQLWGGSLCLDLANTVDRAEDGAHVAPELTDVLTGPDQLARWGVYVGVFAPGAAPAVSRAELERVRALREAVHATFAAIASNAAADPAAVATITDAYATAVATGELVAGDAAWDWEWPPDDGRRVRFATSVDAIRLLADPARLARVTRCPGRHCGWLFVNASGRRRWCSMSSCGSRDKMRRAYRRRRDGLRTPGSPPPGTGAR
jgi:predicted RNA-binding Zn ribbon-like protein